MSTSPFIKTIVALLVGGVVYMVSKIMPKPPAYDQALLALISLGVILYALYAFRIWSGF